MGASVGIARSGLGQSSDEPLAEADAALYGARGKGCVVVADTDRATPAHASQQTA